MMSRSARSQQPTADRTDAPDAMSDDARSRYRTFLIVWFGQLISLPAPSPW